MIIGIGGNTWRYENAAVDYDDSRFHTEFRELYRTLARKNDKIARKKAKGKNGGYVMCKAMDEIEADARAEGICQGISMRENEIIIDMLRRGKTIDEIVDFCNFPYEQVQKIADSIG